MTRAAGTAYIGLGSNVGDSVATLRSAITSISSGTEGTQCTAVAALYTTKPLGPAQANFFNTAVCVRTQLSPRALLDALLALELRHGRVRLERWGPRTLDLDLLLYQTSADAAPMVLHEPGLELPHPGIHARDFVLAPLCDLQAPAVGDTSLSRVLAELPAEARTILSRREKWLG